MHNFWVYMNYDVIPVYFLFKFILRIELKKKERILMFHRYYRKDKVVNIKGIV